MTVYLAIILYPLLFLNFGGLITTGLLIFYSIVIIAVIVGITAALQQRLREIESGEEDDAAKY